MKNARRILSMLLAVLMILSSMVVVTTVSADGTTDPATEDHGTQPTEWWSDHPATAFAGGTGSESDPYQIATPEQMAYFANYLEAGNLNGKTEKTYFQLTASVDMSKYQWKPIGSTAAADAYSSNTLYNAVLDGGNNTVSGVKLTASAAISGYTYTNGCALFASISNSTVQNLKLEAKILDPVLATSGLPSATTADGVDSITNARNGVAALATLVTGISDIKNIEVTVDMDSRNVGGAYSYAGLVANTFGRSTVNLNGVTVNGDIYVDAYGDFNNGSNGLTTANQSSVNVSGVLCFYMAGRIDNLTNNADITVVASKGGTSVGGILSTSFNGLSGSNLLNTGAIEVESATSGATQVGGVFGAFSRCSFVEGYVENTGDIVIHSYNTAVYTGGVVGVANNAATVINGWKNSGDITYYKTTNANGSRLGGIAGSVGAAFSISNCVNDGDLSYVAPNGFAEIYMGGIAGASGSGASIVNCVNNGDLDVNAEGSKGGNLYLGGIVANASASANITGCTNNGLLNYYAVTGSNGQVGGIVGAFASSGSVSDCTNNANVTMSATGTLYTGGIVGALTVKAAGNSIKNCINYGDVSNSRTTSNNAASGIVARTGNSANDVGGMVSIENCVNVGMISQSDLSGGIVGYVSASNVNSTTKVVNPYYASLKNCIGYGSGLTYSVIGRVMSDTTIENCLGNTASLLAYRNQNGSYSYSDGSSSIVKINGASVTGNDIAYNPAGMVATVNIETLDKASIRLDAYGTDESGIRFDSYITKETYTELSKLTGVEYSIGTLIAPTDNLNLAKVVAQYDKQAALDALTKSGNKMYTIVPFEQDFLSEDDANCYFAAAINKIKDNHFDLKFSAIAYLTVTIGDFSFTFYADYDDTNADRARSVAQVAKLAFEDRATEETTIDGVDYSHPALPENECYLGNWSLYSNSQLDLLRKWSEYNNEGMEVPAGLSVNGVSISEYKIVYAQSPIYKTYGSNSGKTLIGDLGNVEFDVVNYSTPTGETVSFGDVLLGARYDYDYQTAVRLQQAIFNKYGVTLEIVPDYDPSDDIAHTDDDVITPVSDYEILVGYTNRAKSQSAAMARMSVDEFTFKINEGTILVGGGSYGATWHAVDALENLFGTLTDGADYNLKMAGDLSGTYKMQKIAAIGDSITRGSQALPDSSPYVSTYGLKGGAYTYFGSNATETYYRYYLSYPASLQRLTWQDAVVYNYGRGSSTAGYYNSNNASNYYEESLQFKDCLADSNSDEIAFDLVFMMHGTNDSGKKGGVSGNSGAYSWTADDKQYFRDAVQSLMDQILKGSPDAIFVFNNIPHRFDSDSVVEAGQGTATSNLTATTSEQNTMAMADIQKEMAQTFAAMKNEDGSAKYTVYLYNMNMYMRENLVVDGVECDCEGYNDPADPDATRPSTNFDSLAEMAAHSYYYNFNSPYGYCEGTHPNFRGYNKMADGVYEVVDYILNGGEKPAYMIDIQ